MSYIFGLGDKVSFGGAIGKVVELTGYNHKYPLLVSFHEYGKETFEEFTLDGRWFEHHTEPLLKLVEKAKKKVTKTLTIHAMVSPDGKVLFPSSGTSPIVGYNVILNGYPQEYIAVECVGTYEVEE